jgi:hypothetical protein
LEAIKPKCLTRRAKIGYGHLYINESLNVSFVVKNVGSQDEDVKVTIEDDKHFAISPQSRTFHLKAWSNQTSYFTVGNIKCLISEN